MNILWTTHAKNCLVEIEDFIASDDPVAAQRWIQKLIQRAEVLAEHPHAGRILPEIPQDKLRELIEGNYRIVYRILGERVEILTVFGRHRLLPKGEIES